MRAYRVSTAVNNVKNCGPECIEPVVSGRKQSPAAGKELGGATRTKAPVAVSRRSLPWGINHIAPTIPL